MSSQVVACPQCHAALRANRPLPDGRCVRCPHCGTFFSASALLRLPRSGPQALVLFAVAGTVAWQQTAIMLVAAATGGYLGAHLALRVHPSRIRIAISVLNFVITGLFFYFRFF